MFAVKLERVFFTGRRLVRVLEVRVAVPALYAEIRFSSGVFPLFE